MVKKEVPYRLLETSKDKIGDFKALPVNIKGRTLLMLSKSSQQEIFASLRNPDVVKLLHYLDPDAVSELLQVLHAKRRKHLLEKLHGSMRKKVELLLRFDPKTAAGLMSLDYVQIPKKTSSKQVLKIVKTHETRTGKFPTMLVVEAGFLLGELSGHSLALCNGRSISKYLDKIPSIKYDADEKEVMELLSNPENNKIVVLDGDNSILGVIYSEDVLRLMQQKSGKELYETAGVRQDEDVMDSAMDKVRNRYKWLILNLATAFLAASVVGLFQETISSFVLLAVYMPVIAGMGGNAGAQALAVAVRGLALKEVELKSGSKVIMNEMLAGATNGIITGALAAIIAVIWSQTALIGVIIGFAMIVNLAVAGFFGAFVPLLMRKLGKDPASSATIFITTCTDVFGFMAFLGLATILLL